MKHTCHWPGCTREVPPRLWGCPPHWFRVPLVLREALKKEYRPGQEITKRPSVRYLVAAALIRGWVEGKVKVRPDDTIELMGDFKLPHV